MANGQQHVAWLLLCSLLLPLALAQSWPSCTIDGRYKCYFSEASGRTNFTALYESNAWSIYFNKTECRARGTYTLTSDAVQYAQSTCTNCLEEAGLCTTGASFTHTVLDGTDSNSNGVCEKWEGLESGDVFECELTAPEDHHGLDSACIIEGEYLCEYTDSEEELPPFTLTIYEDVWDAHVIFTDCYITGTYERAEFSNIFSDWRCHNCNESLCVENMVVEDIMESVKDGNNNGVCEEWVSEDHLGVFDCAWMYSEKHYSASNASRSVGHGAWVTALVTALVLLSGIWQVW